MKLYHGTKKSNIDSITEFGIEPMVSDKISHDTRLNMSVVYAFDNLQSAVDFMVYDQCEQHYAVFMVETDDYILDTEYSESDGAYAIVSDENIMAELVAESDF